MSENSILSVKNYREYFEGGDIPNILENYINLQQEFLLYMQENIIIQDPNYYIFLIQRGFDTMKHIFNNLILYTKNVDLTIHHCKKVFIYYIEFVEQIVNEQHHYLQLNSKDAILFIYKKTIFEINNEYRKKFTLTVDEKVIINVVNTIQEIFNELIKNTLIKEGDQFKNREEIFLKYISTVVNIMNHILKYENFQISHLELHSKLDALMYFTNYISHAEAVDGDKMLAIINHICRKMYTKDLCRSRIEKKINDMETSDKLKSLTPLKYANWIYI